MIFHNIYYASLACKRNIEMTPLCQLETTLPEGFSGGIRGHGSTDERWGAWAARGSEGSRSTAADGVTLGFKLFDKIQIVPGVISI
jgi:hypothetical protein